MKILLFLVLLIFVYFIATQIKVVHVNTLPNGQRTEINNRNKIRSILMSNHIKCSTQNDSKKSTDNYLFNISDFIIAIRSKYLDNQHEFNVANQPVTTRYPNQNTKLIDDKYIYHIKKNIRSWNKTFETIYINNIKPVLIIETLNEFIIKLNTKLYYQKKILYFELIYYGKIERSDDFFNGNYDIYALQLTNIKPITSVEYNNFPRIRINSEVDQQLQETNDHNCFMTMSEQLEYVNKIHKLHGEEMFS